MLFYPCVNNIVIFTGNCNPLYQSSAEGIILKTEFFMALRYLKPRRSEVSVIAVLSVLGVTLGVAVLVIVLAVMTGFIDLFKQKLIETQAHLTISIPNRIIYDPQPVIDAVADAGGTAVRAICQPALVQDSEKRFSPKMLIGVDPEGLEQQYNFESVLLSGTWKLDFGEILISSSIASEFRLGLGDKLLIHAPNKLAELVEVSDSGAVKLADSKEVFLPHEFTVAGIYSFGKSDFDKQFIFACADDAAELYGMPWDAATMVLGWVDDPYNMEKELKSIREKLGQLMPYSGIRAAGWQEANQTLLGVLEMEKRMMFFLLIFIILVAAFSITNTLITSVYQKTQAIGVLKALGATAGQIMRIFIWQGFLVGVFGAVIGVISGCVLVAYRNDVLGFIRSRGSDPFPKEFYYFNELPAHLVPGDLLLVGGCAILLCTIGALLPAWRAATLDPAKALRYE